MQDSRDRYLKIIFVLVVLLIIVAVTAAWFRGESSLAKKDLETANRAVLSEANLNVSLRNTVRQLRDERDAARAQLKAREQGIIIGQAFVDTDFPCVGALDNNDRPASGLKIQLYKITRGGRDGEYRLLVAETTVKHDGIYRFTVSPGGYWDEYVVLPLLAMPGYPAWKHATHLNSQGHLIVTRGEVIIGPTFLISDVVDGKG